MPLRPHPSPANPRRQWGADTREAALPPVPLAASSRAVGAARVAIFVTVLGWAAFLAATLNNAFFGSGFSVAYAFEAILYIAIVTVLAASALAFLLARLGFLYRTRQHHPVARARLDSFFEMATPGVTVLVPSYREEPAVVEQTLLSAALQEFPRLRVVLLIDDPPDPTDRSHRSRLEETRELPLRITELLQQPATEFTVALDDFESRVTCDGDVSVDDLDRLADHYGTASDTLERLTSVVSGDDHSAEFLRREVVHRLAGEFTAVREALRRAAEEEGTVTRARMVQLYRRLVWTFTAEVTSFERKRYLSLSHEPNKAMNLNSYLGLMGGRYVEQQTVRGPVLVPSGGSSYDVDVPEADYVLTLDADSVLLPEYCLRLVYLLEQPEFERVAVAQTPYSAFPGAATRLERIAGATTDVQHIVHQGLTQYGATFWVGANAVLRKRALDDIAETDVVGGQLIRRYIQDRTPIEDTESSIDLVANGWDLYNYPERLSYSATPPDFGSLCIQRQRWANGGLLILGKLRNSQKRRPARRARRRTLADVLLRTNYLASIATGGVGLVILLAFPLDGTLLTPLALVTALPYFVAMASDLKLCGYKRTDVVRIYGFNLLLLPVNLAGTLKSIGQAITGQKAPFARTPKVKNRTTAAITFVLLPYAIIAFSVLTIWRDVNEHHYVHAVYAGVNAVLCAYAVLAFIGFRNSLVDIWANVVKHLYRPASPAPAPVEDELDWTAVLYGGAPESAYATEVPAPPAVAGLETRSVGPSTMSAVRGADSLTVAASGTGQVKAQRAHPGATADEADLARVMAQYLRDVRDRGRVVFHLDDTSVELELNPVSMEESAA